MSLADSSTGARGPECRLSWLCSIHCDGPVSFAALATEYPNVPRFAGQIQRV
jgi:hypothetical protein